MKQQTVHINGVAYDSVTGLRITPRKSAERTKSHAHVVHATAQKSKTLTRKHVSKAKPAIKKPIEVKSAAASPHKIQKFADIKPTKRNIQHAYAKKVASNDIKPQAHPVIARVHATHAVRKAATAAPTKPTAATLTSKEIKHQTVSDSLKKAPSHSAKKQVKASKKENKFGRFASVASASLAVLMLAGYFTYLNMPNLSVRVAAAQAGVEATYPSYRPDGYSLQGRIAYDTDSVSMKFASNSSDNNFTLNQSSSDWDSTALQQNYIDQKWGDSVSATIHNGITIYSHGGEAAWVNGGILYTIQGDAPLSNSQLARIATSL